MRVISVFVLAAALLAGCGESERKESSTPITPEQVVRAWSAALNRSDNRTAASLFVDGSKIAQGDVEYTLASREERIAFNSGLPCSGLIVDLHASGEDVTATFELGERPNHRCDAPGVKTTAVFTVRNGRIIAFRQLPAPEQGPAA